MIKHTLAALFLLAGMAATAQESSNQDHSFQESIITENDTVKPKKGLVLQEVIINNNPNLNPVSIGKANIKPMDLPQATALIGHETIEQQQILRLSDVVRNTNGVYVSGASNASGNNQEELGARGFTFSGANTFKNGVRFNGSLIPEVSSLESIEILKGNSALLFGNVGPGAIMNLITKKPRFSSGGEVSFRVSEYDFFKPTVDVYGSINNSKTAAFRMISSYEKGNSFRKAVESERFYFNPSILFNITDRTELVIEGDYLKDTRTPDFGLTTINYEVIELPRNSFLGFDWGKFDSMQQSLSGTLTHQFSDLWQVRTTMSYQGYETNLLSNLRPNATNLVQADGTWRRGVQKIDTKQDYAIVQTDFTGEFTTGSLKHSLLVGFDADQSNTTTAAFKNINYFDEINIYNPEIVLNVNPDYAFTNVPTFDRNTNTAANVKRAGLYAQDLVSLTSKLKVLAGLRYSYLENTTNVFAFTTGEFTKTATHDNVITPKGGIVFQPTENYSIFGSYSNSFALNTGTDRNLKALPVSTIHQYEAGLKSLFYKGNLSANFTAYMIDYSNLAQTDLSNGNTNTNIKELAGSYKTQGVEIDIAGKYRNFKLIAGYAFNESYYTESNIYQEGTPLRFTPKHTANASIFYTVATPSLKGIELGLMSSYIGNRFGGRLHPMNPTTPAEEARRLIPVDGFFQLDASLGYAWQNLSLRAKLSNIANVVSYYVYDDNTVTPIAPRMISATVGYKF